MTPKTATKKTKSKAVPVDAEDKKTSAKRTRTDRPSDRYFAGVGRRKTAVARVKLFTRGDRDMSVNGKPLAEYFTTPALAAMARAALSKMNVEDKFRVAVVVYGGGLMAQAEAMRHGTSRALLAFNPEFRKRLKRAGYLTRDSRKVERKKAGLKKARRAPQWSKR